MKNRRISRYIYSGSISVFLLLLLSGLSYLNEYAFLQNDQNNSSFRKTNHSNEIPQFISTADHKINVFLDPGKKVITADHELAWINTTSFSTGEVQFHLYPNAFKNNNTPFVKGRKLQLTQEDKSEIKFTHITVDNREAAFVFIQPEIKNIYDSTVAKIILPEIAEPGDTVRFFFSYEVVVPKNSTRFGYASGRNFFFISQWYPKPGVFEYGKWICSQYHPYTNFYSDFGTYDVTIDVPENYQVGSTGGAYNQIDRKNNRNIYHVREQGIHDFAWMASDEITKDIETYTRKDKSTIDIITFIQPENVKYKSRFINAIKNCLRFFEEYIAPYPYKTITLIDAPKTSMAGGREYPTLITVNAKLFSPIETQQPEYLTVHEFTHQYFYGIIANNEVYEAWLDEGLTTYITTKILKRYYGDGLISFNLFNYYPIMGLNFLSYNEIPLIYSLGEFNYPEGATSLSRYLRAPQLYSITDTSYLLPEPFLYGNASYSKPELVLISLERYLGFDKVMNILKEYYTKYKFKHPSSKDFLSIIQQNSREDLTWFFEHMIYGSSEFDYRIKYVRPAMEPNVYDVYIERLGDGVFKQDVALYTNRDTLMRRWEGKERVKIIKFRTSDEVIGAEIDPARKNILDQNYANNTYLIKYQYGGSIGLTFRWFFWMQNLLLILGSIA